MKTINMIKPVLGSLLNLAVIITTILTFGEAMAESGKSVDYVTDRGVDSLLAIASEQKVDRAGIVKELSGRKLRDFGDGYYSVELPPELIPTREDLKKTFGNVLRSKTGQKKLRRIMAKRDAIGVRKLLASGVDNLPKLMVRRYNGVTKLYIGQAHYAWKPKRLLKKHIKEDNSRKSVIDQLTGTVTVDAHGRRWMAINVDAKTLLKRIEDYNKEAAEPGVDKTLTIADLHKSEPATGISEGEWTPQAWHKEDCGKDDIRRWDLDHRERKTSLNDRRKTTVMVVAHELGNPPGGVEGLCSGVMVDDEWALTAAHCVTDDQGREIDHRRISICSWGNAYSGAECKGVVDITKAPKFYGSGTKHDYAVVKISPPFSHGHFMFISSTSDSTIKDTNQQNLAYPGFAKQCGGTGAPSQISVYPATYLYSHGASVISVKKNIIKTRHDGVGGHSGSPLFYCPSGDANVCEAGDKGYITGVWSGWYNTFPNSGDGHRGPKGPAIRSWVIAETP